MILDDGSHELRIGDVRYDIRSHMQGHVISMIMKMITVLLKGLQCQ